MCNFRDPNLVTLYLCMYLIVNKEHFTFHLQYKHSGTFANYKYEELYHKNQKTCNLILVTLLKMRPHDSQCSRENATPSSGTSPVASYKEVTPPPGLNSRCLRHVDVLWRYINMAAPYWALLIFVQNISKNIETVRKTHKPKTWRSEVISCNIKIS